MGDRIKAWLLSLDYPQRRALAGVTALVVVLGLALGLSAVFGSDGSDGDAIALETEGSDESTSTTDADTTSSSEVDDSSSTSAPEDTDTTKKTTTTKKGTTSTTKKGSKGTSTTSGGGSGGSSTTSTTQATSTTAGVTSDGGGATAVANLFTSYRADPERNLNAMTRSSGLDQEAAARAKRMAEDHELQHYPGGDAAVFGACASCTGWAENVGYATDNAPHVWQSWLDSPDHKKHIDDPRAGFFGMGAYRSPDGYIWMVHLFGFTG